MIDFLSCFVAFLVCFVYGTLLEPFCGEPRLTVKSVTVAGKYAHRFVWSTIDFFKINKTNMSHLYLSRQHIHTSVLLFSL